MNPAPLRPWERALGAGRLRVAVGWFLLAAALLPCTFREGLYISEQLPPAMLIAAIMLLFLFLLRPRLGWFYEWRGALNALLVFATATLGFSHVLANAGDWGLARFYRWAQTGSADLLSHAVGEGLARLVVSPLYLLSALILLLSFAYRSYKGFVLFLVLVASSGLYPFRADIVAGYLLWLAGFSLLLEEPLYLPARVRERLPLTGPMRDLLLELRARPLPARHALFLLCGQTVDEARALPREIVRQLSQLAGSGLVVYDPAAKVLEPSQVLRESHAPPGVAALVDAGSFAAQALILAVGVLYLLVPVDVLPEAALGPLGYLDDLVLLLLASLPLGHTLLSRRPALLRRRFNRPTGS